MSVDEFRKLLETLAELHESRDEPEDARGLRNLAELFDGRRGNVATLVSKVRRVRGLSNA